MNELKHWVEKNHTVVERIKILCEAVNLYLHVYYI